MSQKYRVTTELGQGGMGKVFRGVLIGQAGFERPVVMKQLLDTESPHYVQLFVQEARRYALLDHENIGRIFDFERVAGKLCIVLEYIGGFSLVQYIEQHKLRKRLPDVELSVFVISRLCRALQYVFEKAKIVHRDVSPGNIMMTREGTVKLIDFGIAVSGDATDQSLTGKPAYMAPEMVMELRADSRSDIFSLGTVLFEMLTLSRLFQGETTSEVLQKVVSGHFPSPRQVNPDIPDGVLVLLKKALQRDPGRRYASAGEMGQACEHYLYDKGYGPTNLTLKHYLRELFGEDEPAVDLLDLLEPVPVRPGEPTPRVEPPGHRTSIAGATYARGVGAKPARPAHPAPAEAHKRRPKRS